MRAFFLFFQKAGLTFDISEEQKVPDSDSEEEEVKASYEIDAKKYEPINDLDLIRQILVNYLYYYNTKEKV